MAFSERHDDLLADILWWIDGFLTASAIEGRTCRLHDGHIEAIKAARVALAPEPVDAEDIPF